MTDLILRLRNIADCYDEDLGLDAKSIREAADEIERLKNEVRYQGEHICATNDRLIVANAEIERLRAQAVLFVIDEGKMADEIERLRAELAKQRFNAD